MVPPVTRRSFIAGMAALPALRAGQALSALPVNPGLIIIGGGVAGLAAANRLRSRGHQALILEAKNRLGGRVHTEWETFGFPYDHGADTLYSANVNPLAQLIRDRRYDLLTEAQPETWVYLDGKEASPEQYDAIGRALGDLSYQMDYGIEHYGREQRDVSIAQLSRPASRYDVLAHATIGPLFNGAETDRLSLYDIFQQTTTGVQWGVPDGLGHVIIRILGDVPHLLSTPVRRVYWGSSDVQVETDRGMIATRGVLITVPPIIMHEKRLNFDPPLTGMKQDAIAALPAATYDKIAFSFQPGFLDAVPANTACLIQNGESGPVWEFIIRPHGRDMAVGTIGGKGANLLRLQTVETAKRAALGALISAFGSGVRMAVDKSHYTNWSMDEWIRCSYSYQRIGALYARENLARTERGRLFFAGEATSIEWAGSVTGAYLSGIRAADDMIRRLDL